MQAKERLEAKGIDIEAQVLKGDELRDAGYGMLYAVGKAAVEPPALVVLSHVPKGEAAESVCLVGKGIVYDTGGTQHSQAQQQQHSHAQQQLCSTTATVPLSHHSLPLLACYCTGLSLKTKEGMPGMKADCGGAAATLGAFEAALEIGVGEEKALHLILCLAENAIGPVSARERERESTLVRERKRTHSTSSTLRERAQSARERTLRRERESTLSAHSPHSPLITSLLSLTHTPSTIPFHSHTPSTIPFHSH